SPATYWLAPLSLHPAASTATQPIEIAIRTIAARITRVRCGECPSPGGWPARSGDRARVPDVIVAPRLARCEVGAARGIVMVRGRTCGPRWGRGGGARVAVLAAVLAAGVMGGRGPAAAQGGDEATAQALFNDGRRLMASRDWESAADKLRASDRVSPSVG